MLGRYRLVKPIGRGGMGEVWLATATGSGGFTKKVVVKTVLPERADDPSFVEMLTREARMCAELSHPNLIEVFDFSEHDGVYMIAMEYVVGRSLSQIVRAAKVANSPIPPWFALRMIWECCRGLECAHSHKIIHCDLSPGNVMLSFTGFTKVLDFGVAHSIQAGLKADRLKGKYHYMAPERIRSLVTDARTDVYSLGVILYVLFTGRLPISAATDEALLYAIVNEKPKPPSAHRVLPRDIEDVILCAMQYDPARRFQDVGSMALAIAQCRDGHPAACTQSDMAQYLGALFPDAPDLPEHLRVALRQSGAVVSEFEAEESHSLLAYSSAELEDLDSVSADLVPEPAADETFSLLPSSRRPRTPSNPPERAPTAPDPDMPVPAVSPADGSASYSVATGSDARSPDANPVRRLFEGAGAPRATPRTLFDGSSTIDGVSRALFSDSNVAIGSSPGEAEHAEQPAPSETVPLPRSSDIFSTVRAPEPASTTARGAFGEVNKEGEEAWPWATSLIKPS
ncbi:MAG TPA: protein kinase [Kofleriaceae bacterium]|nr:protein kinase [Kofleriaceae bacterium]